MDIDSHKVWLIVGITIAILAVAGLVLYPYAKEGFAGQAIYTKGTLIKYMELKSISSPNTIKSGTFVYKLNKYVLYTGSDPSIKRAVNIICKCGSSRSTSVPCPGYGVCLNINTKSGTDFTRFPLIRDLEKVPTSVYWEFYKDYTLTVDGAVAGTGSTDIDSETGSTTGGATGSTTTATNCSLPPEQIYPAGPTSKNNTCKDQQFSTVLVLGKDLGYYYTVELKGYNDSQTSLFKYYGSGTHACQYEYDLNCTRMQYFEPNQAKWEFFSEGSQKCTGSVSYPFYGMSNTFAIRAVCIGSVTSTFSPPTGCPPGSSIVAGGVCE